MNKIVVKNKTKVTNADKIERKRKHQIVAQQRKVIDLDSIRMDGLLSNLRSLTNSSSRKPSDCALIWSGERIVRKQQLDGESANHIISQIERLGLSAETLARTKASMLYSQQLIFDIIEQNEYEAELKIEEFKTQIYEQQHTRLSLDDDASSRLIELDRLKLHNEGLKADNAEKLARANLTQAQVRLVNNVVDGIDLDKPTYAQVLLLVKALDPKATADVNASATEEMLKEQLREMHLKNEGEVIKNEDRQADVDLKKFNYEVSMKDELDAIKESK